MDDSCRWFLDCVEVTPEGGGRTAYFACRSWLERRNGYEATLTASASDPGREEAEYKVCEYVCGVSVGVGVCGCVG